MGASIKVYLDTVREILAVASKVCYVNRSDYRFEELEEFLEATGEFPSDVINVLEAASIVASPGGGFPSKEEIEILEACWEEAWSWSGKLSWKYSHGDLTLRYSPKHTGAYYEVRFTPGAKGGHMCFPLEVRFRAWADMDDKDNHADECPMCCPWLVEKESHSDGCPFRDLGGGADEEEIDAALEGCECEFDCNCEPDIETEEETVFTEDEAENFKPLFVKWLTDLLH